MKKKSKARRIMKITALSLAAVIVAGVITAGVVLWGRIASMMSIRHVGDDLYTMNFQQDYHLDKALAANIRNEEELVRFICDDMFFGYQIDANLQKYSCSAFITPTPDGKYLAGRNFGLGGSDSLCLYTHPQGSYASVSTVSTDMLSVGAGNELAVTDVWGRAALLAAPYIGVDGMNEKGLTTALLDLEQPATHMDTGKPDLPVTVAVRLVLDRAATVDEAVDLLGQYDIHTGHGKTQHMFLADANGDAAVVEWHRNEMKVVKSPVCTNFRMSQKVLNGVFTGECDRFDLLDSALKEKPRNTAEDSMKLLEAVKQDYPEIGIHTEWSAVFHLTDFTLDYAVDMNYNRIYHLNPKEF